MKKQLILASLLCLGALVSCGGDKKPTSTVDSGNGTDSTSTDSTGKNSTSGDESQIKTEWDETNYTAEPGYVYLDPNNAVDWSSYSVYAWEPTGGTLPAGVSSWPGKPMEKDETTGFYKFNLGADITGCKIIFTGDGQTPDKEYDPANPLFTLNGTFEKGGIPAKDCPSGVWTDINHKVQAPSKKVVSTEEVMSIKGGYNGWVATDMERQDDGTYTSTFSSCLPNAEYCVFSRSKLTWDDESVTYDETAAVYYKNGGEGNLSVANGEWKITFDATADDAEKVKAEKVKDVDVVPPSDIYMRGSKSGWAETDDYKLTAVEGQEGKYSITTYVAGGDEFKFEGYNWGWQAPLATGADSAYFLVTEGGNIKLGDESYSGIYTFTVDVSTQTTSVVLVELDSARGTEAAPLSVTAAAALVSKYADKTFSSGIGYVTGKVISIQVGASGQYNVVLTDPADSTKNFTVYWGDLAEGVTVPAVGDIIVAKGYLYRFGSTYEFSKNNDVSPEIIKSTHQDVTITVNATGCTLTDEEGVALATSAKTGDTLKFKVALNADMKAVTVKINNALATADENGVYTVAVTDDIEISAVATATETTYTLANTLTFTGLLPASEAAAKTLTAEDLVAGTVQGESNKLVSVDSVSTCYKGANGGSGTSAYTNYDVLKIGKSSAAGSLKLTFEEGTKISKVVVKAMGWKTTATLKVNNNESDQFTTIINKDNSDAGITNAEEKVFILDEATNVLEIASGGSTCVCIFSIEVYTAD